MVIRPIIAWYDFWVGLFFKQKYGPRGGRNGKYVERIYVFPIPCIGFVIFPHESATVTRFIDKSGKVVQECSESEHENDCQPYEPNDRCGGCFECMMAQHSYHGGTFRKVWRPIQLSLVR